MKKTLLLTILFLWNYSLLANTGAAYPLLANKVTNNEEQQNKGETFLRVETFPWTEDFEDPITDWLVFNLAGSEGTWVISTAENHTPGGQFSAYHRDAEGDQEGWLVSPQILLPDQQMELRFWSLNTFSDFYGKNSVLISTNSFDPEDQDYVEVWTTPSVSQTWVETVIDLSEFQNQDIYVAFRYEGNFAHGWFLDDVRIAGIPSSEEITVDLRVILEGAYQPASGALMHTILNDNDLLPNSQPYGPPLPYYGNTNPVWYYQGSESTSTFASTAVDWVLVELRDAPSAAQATSSTVIARRAGILNENGAITSPNGLPLIFDVAITYGIYAVVYHRNHLAVMSSSSLPLTEGVYFWDFTQNINAAFEQGQKTLAAGIYGMIGGDGDGNGQVQSQDKNNVWDPLAGTGNLYLPSDFNLDGQVQTQDKNDIWDPNSGLGSQVPDSKKTIFRSFEAKH